MLAVWLLTQIFCSQISLCTMAQVAEHRWHFIAERTYLIIVGDITSSVYANILSLFCTNQDFSEHLPFCKLHNRKSFLHYVIHEHLLINILLYLVHFRLYFLRLVTFHLWAHNCSTNHPACPVLLQPWALLVSFLSCSPSSSLEHVSLRLFLRCLSLCSSFSRCSIFHLSLLFLLFLVFFGAVVHVVLFFVLLPLVVVVVVPQAVVLDLLDVIVATFLVWLL